MVRLKMLLNLLAQCMHGQVDQETSLANDSMAHFNNDFRMLAIFTDVLRVTSSGSD